MPHMFHNEVKKILETKKNDFYVTEERIGARGTVGHRLIEHLIMSDMERNDDWNLTTACKM